MWLSGLALLLSAGLVSSASASGQEWRWDASSVMPRAGTLQRARDEQGFLLKLSEAGIGVLELPTAELPLDRMDRLRVRLGPETGPIAVDLVWWLELGKSIASQPLTPSGDGVREADLSARDDWPEAIHAVALRFRGAGDAVIAVETIELTGEEGLAGLREAFLSAFVPTPWTHASINAYFLPESWWWGLLVIAWLGGLSAAVAVTLGVYRHKRRAGAGGLLLLLCFLPGWLALDLVWLYQLQHRSADTVARFSGKSERAALLATGDRALVRRAKAVADVLDDGRRVFVVSEGDYQGMRQAYYLYPHNVYWMRTGPRLPPPEQMRAGDAVLLLNPVHFRLDEAAGRLEWPDNDGAVSVRVVWRDSISCLLLVEGGAS